MKIDTAGSRKTLAVLTALVFVLLFCAASFCSASVPGVLSSGENAFSAVCTAYGDAGMVQRRSNVSQKILAALKCTHIFSALSPRICLSRERISHVFASDISALSSVLIRSVILRL